jgi:hypothetical protein
MMGKFSSRCLFFEQERLVSDLPKIASGKHFHSLSAALLLVRALLFPFGPMINTKTGRRKMDTKAIITGLWGLLFLTTPAFAEPPLAAAEKAYRLLLTLSSQLQEAQKSLDSQSPAPAAAALATAEEQVHVAFSHCCHALYAAHLQAAKGALTQHDQQAALQHLLKADETLERCPAHPPGAEPQHEQDDADLKSALARR